METNLGAGQNFMRDFTADFAGSEIYMGGKTFPKGHFTVAVLNHGKALRMKLLYLGLPLRDALKQLADRAFTEEVYDKAVAAVWEIQKELSAVEPFCYLDMEQEADLLDAVLSEDSKQTMTDCFQIAANHFYTDDPSNIQLSAEEKSTLDKGLYIHDCLKRIFNSYFYFCRYRNLHPAEHYGENCPAAAGTGVCYRYVPMVRWNGNRGWTGGYPCWHGYSWLLPKATAGVSPTPQGNSHHAAPGILEAGI